MKMKLFLMSPIEKVCMETTKIKENLDERKDYLNKI